MNYATCSSRMKTHICIMLIAALMMANLSVFSVQAAGQWTDLPESHWAHQTLLQANELGIVNGLPDGTIQPDGILTWGEYLTMLSKTFQGDAYQQYSVPSDAHWAYRYYLAVQGQGIIQDFMPVKENLLDTPVSRQDAAVLTVQMVEGPPQSAPEPNITDFGELSADYRPSVARAYELKLLSGYPDGTFKGTQTLSRAEGAVILLHALDISKQASNSTSSSETNSEEYSENDSSELFGSELEHDLWEYVLKDLFHDSVQHSDGEGSFQYNDNGWSYSWQGSSGSATYSYLEYYFNDVSSFDHGSFPNFPFGGDDWDGNDLGLNWNLDSIENGWNQDWDSFWGRSTVEVGDPLVRQGENRAKHERLFGDEQTRRFSSRAEAESNMVSIKVPVWRLRNGVKTSGTAYLQIHKALADDVVEIFTEIFNDPEQFPIHGVGGYSWRGDSATGEHNCGSAIDINTNENYQVRDGKAQTGKLWQPGENPYSIPEDGSVVRIFKEHGWSWGGNAWAYDSDQTSGYHDYMHFSYMGG